MSWSPLALGPARHAVIRGTGCLLASSSAVLHVITMMSHESPLVAVVMTAMAVACLFCAVELLRRDTVRAWMLVAVMNIVMIGLHLPMAGGHHHTTLVPKVMGSGGASAMTAATAVALAEVVLATAVLWLRTRCYTDRLAGSDGGSGPLAAPARRSALTSPSRAPVGARRRSSPPIPWSPPAGA